MQTQIKFESQNPDRLPLDLQWVLQAACLTEIGGAHTVWRHTPLPWRPIRMFSNRNRGQLRYIPKKSLYVKKKHFLRISMLPSSEPSRSVKPALTLALKQTAVKSRTQNPIIAARNIFKFNYFTRSTFKSRMKKVVMSRCWNEPFLYTKSGRQHLQIVIRLISATLCTFSGEIYEVVAIKLLFERFFPQEIVSRN